MVAGLLHGRIHLNTQEFRQQNHMMFFSNVLAILELLQPLVFHSNHQRALQDCVLSFMKVLRVRRLTHCQVFTIGFSLEIRRNHLLQIRVLQCSYMCLCIFSLVELPEDSFSVGLHQQVFAVHTEIHYLRCSGRHSLFTEALWHLAVSTSWQTIIEFTVFTATTALLEICCFSCQGSVCRIPRPGSTEISAGWTHSASEKVFCRGFIRRQRWWAQEGLLTSWCCYRAHIYLKHKNI